MKIKIPEQAVYSQRRLRVFWGLLLVAVVATFSTLAIFRPDSSVNDVPLSGPWNSSDKQQNVIECVNGSARRLELVLSLLDSEQRELKSIPFNLEPNASRHFPLQELGIKDSYGMFQVHSFGAPKDTEEVACWTLFYKFPTGSTTKAVEYVYALPKLDPLLGESAGVYNSYNPNDRSLPNSNILSIYNPGFSPFSARVDVYLENGEKDAAAGFRLEGLKPGAKKDFAIGDPRRFSSGHYVIRPDDAAIPYGAFLLRYNRESSNGPIRYVLPFEARGGSCKYSAIPSGSLEPAENWGEVANPTDSPVPAIFRLYDPNGNLQFEESRSIAAHSMQFVSLHGILGSTTFGRFEVVCAADAPANAKLLVSSVTFGKSRHEPGILWAHASSAGNDKPLQSGRLLLPVNTFMQAANSARLMPGGEKINSTVGQVFHADGKPLKEDVFNISPKALLETALNPIAGKDSLGLFAASSADACGVLDSELARVFPDSRGGTGYIATLPAIVVGRKENTCGGVTFKQASAPAASAPAPTAAAAKPTPTPVPRPVDSDNDGHVDKLDAFPKDPIEWLDSDKDGIGNFADKDEDNDKVPDEEDELPFDSKASAVPKYEVNATTQISLFKSLPLVQIPSRIRGRIEKGIASVAVRVFPSVGGRFSTVVRLKSPAQFRLNTLTRTEFEANGGAIRMQRDRKLQSAIRSDSIDAKTNMAIVLSRSEASTQEVTEFEMFIVPDTDGDGLPDDREIAIGADRYNSDVDADGVSDGTEVTYLFLRDKVGERPAACKALLDCDKDGIPNWQDRETDGDGLSDFIEGEVDPDADGAGAFLDTDSDGNSILDRKEGGSDQLHPRDTDGDSTPDYLDLDDDNDGLTDLMDDDRIVPLKPSLGTIEELSQLLDIEYVETVIDRKRIPDVAIKGRTLEVTVSGPKSKAEAAIVILNDSNGPLNLKPLAPEIQDLSLRPPSGATNYVLKVLVPETDATSLIVASLGSRTFPRTFTLLSADDPVLFPIVTPVVAAGSSLVVGGLNLSGVVSMDVSGTIRPASVSRYGNIELPLKDGDASGEVAVLTRNGRRSNSVSFFLQRRIKGRIDLPLGQSYSPSAFLVSGLFGSYYEVKSDWTFEVPMAADNRSRKVTIHLKEDPSGGSPAPQPTASPQPTVTPRPNSSPVPVILPYGTLGTAAPAVGTSSSGVVQLTVGATPTPTPSLRPIQYTGASRPVLSAFLLNNDTSIKVDYWSTAVAEVAGRRRDFRKVSRETLADFVKKSYEDAGMQALKVLLEQKFLGGAPVGLESEEVENSAANATISMTKKFPRQEETEQVGSGETPKAKAASASRAAPNNSLCNPIISQGGENAGITINADCQADSLLVRNPSPLPFSLGVKTFPLKYVTLQQHIDDVSDPLLEGQGMFKRLFDFIIPIPTTSVSDVHFRDSLVVLIGPGQNAASSEKLFGTEELEAGKAIRFYFMLYNVAFPLLEYFIDSTIGVSNLFGKEGYKDLAIAFFKSFNAAVLKCPLEFRDFFSSVAGPTGVINDIQAFGRLFTSNCASPIVSYLRDELLNIFERALIKKLGQAYRGPFYAIDKHLFQGLAALGASCLRILFLGIEGFSTAYDLSSSIAGLVTAHPKYQFTVDYPLEIHSVTPTRVFPGLPLPMFKAKGIFPSREVKFGSVKYSPPPEVLIRYTKLNGSVETQTVEPKYGNSYYELSFNVDPAQVYFSKEIEIGVRTGPLEEVFGVKIPVSTVPELTIKSVKPITDAFDNIEIDGYGFGNSVTDVRLSVATKYGNRVEIPIKSVNDPNFGDPNNPGLATLKAAIPEYLASGDIYLRSIDRDRVSNSVYLEVPRVDLEVEFESTSQDVGVELQIGGKKVGDAPKGVLGLYKMNILPYKEKVFVKLVPQASEYPNFYYRVSMNKGLCRTHPNQGVPLAGLIMTSAAPQLMWEVEVRKDCSDVVPRMLYPPYPERDSDGDGVKNAVDCAPNDPQKWQTQAYPDTDGDGVANSLTLGQVQCYGLTPPSGYLSASPVPTQMDNCPTVFNPDQTDRDNDGIGNACDVPAATDVQLIFKRTDGVGTNCFKTIINTRYWYDVWRFGYVPQRGAIYQDTTRSNLGALGDYHVGTNENEFYMTTYEPGGIYQLKLNPLHGLESNEQDAVAGCPVPPEMHQNFDGSWSSPYRDTFNVRGSLNGQPINLSLSVVPFFEVLCNFVAPEVPTGKWKYCCNQAHHGQLNYACDPGKPDGAPPGKYPDPGR